MQKEQKAEKKKYDIPTVEEMLEAGLHFGHQTRRWNPAMEKYIYSTDHKTHVIDIFQTRSLIEKACDFLYETAKAGKQIVIVGTKRQASSNVEVYAKDCGALYVNQRWLGGTFTNFNEIRNNWKELNRLIEKRDTDGFLHYTKKERLLIDRKIQKLETFVGGINGMKKYPGALVVVDIKREKTAVKEANSVNVPVVGIVDTNSEPRSIDYVVPANDDAIKSIEILLKTLTQAIKAGYEDFSKSVKEVKETKETAEKVKPVKLVKKRKPSAKKVGDEKEAEKPAEKSVKRKGAATSRTTKKASS